MPFNSDLGSNVYKLRSQQKWTLDELAERSKVSRAMLSDIERGVKNPTIKVVCQIAETFGYTVSQLIGEDEIEEKKFVITRRDERHVVVEPGTGVQRHLLSRDFVKKGLEIILYIIPPGQTGSFPAHRHDTMEHITVIEGNLKYFIGDKKGILREGDSVFFAANLDHDFYNSGTEHSHFFLIIDSTSVE